MEPKTTWKDFFIDPGSGQYSTSRLCTWFLGLIGLPAYMTLAATVPQFPVKEVGQVIIALGATFGGIYFGNSAAGAWKRDSQQQEQ